MNRTLIFSLLMLIVAVPVMAAEGLVNVQSDYSVKATSDRLEGILKDKGMTIFNRINHSVAAAGAGIQIGDTELIIFGNPKVGSPLMKCRQSVAIDLPQKILIWSDDKSNVWISYNDPRYLEKRHNIMGCEKVIAKIEKVLPAIAKSAATK